MQVRTTKGVEKVDCVRFDINDPSIIKEYYEYDGG